MFLEMAILKNISDGVILVTSTMRYSDRQLGRYIERNIHREIDKENRRNI